MSTRPLSILLDTNILLDLFDAARPGYEAADKLVKYAVENQVPLLVTPLSLKDFYYLQTRALKRTARGKRKRLSEDAAAAAEEFAWGCVEYLVELASVLSVGLVDVELARSLHRIHRDFEDDLLLATAQRAEVSCLVTSDVKLAAKSPVPTFNAADLLTLLAAS